MGSGHGPAIMIQFNDFPANERRVSKAGTGFLSSLFWKVLASLQRFHQGSRAGCPPFGYHGCQARRGLQSSSPALHCVALFVVQCIKRPSSSGIKSAYKLLHTHLAQQSRRGSAVEKWRVLQCGDRGQTGFALVGPRNETTMRGSSGARIAICEGRRISSTIAEKVVSILTILNFNKFFISLKVC